MRKFFLFFLIFPVHAMDPKIKQLQKGFSFYAKNAASPKTTPQEPYQNNALTKGYDYIGEIERVICPALEIWSPHYPAKRTRYYPIESTAIIMKKHN